MAGLLEYLLQQQPFAAQPAGFADMDAAAVPDTDPFEVAAGRVRRSVKRPSPWPAQEPIPGIGAVAGLLSGMGSTGQAPPSTNDPMAQEPQLDVPLPRPRPTGIDDPQQPVGAPLSLAPGDYADRLPPNAQQTSARSTPVAAAEPSFLEGLGKKIFDPAKAATWLALGSGFAGAPSIGTGMRRAFSNAIPAMAADRAQITSRSKVADTYRALVAKGVPPAEALAASQNPDIMKATAAKYFETKPSTPHKIGTDMMGNDIMGVFDPNANGGKGGYYDAAGRSIGTGGAAGGVGIPDAGAGMLAKGVTEINQDLPAEEYKKQFSPQVQAQIDNYVSGDTMPTGNPRIKGSATRVKEWAQLYGSKAGVPVSDSEFARKRTMQNQIASSAPNSMGGILSNGKSAFGHLASLGENFVQLANRSGPSIPGGSHIGRAANITGNSVLPTPETSGNLAAVRDNAGKYGAEATKFYAGTGGGVEERLLALREVGAPGTLATEQAAYLKTEKNLMLERIAQKEAQIREVMGDAWLAKHPVRNADLQHAIDRIDASVKKLEAGVSSSAAPGVTSTGIKWSVQ